MWNLTTSEEKVVENVLKQLESYELEAIIVGHPIEMKGSVGQMALTVQVFCNPFRKKKQHQNHSLG